MNRVSCDAIRLSYCSRRYYLREAPGFTVPMDQVQVSRSGWLSHCRVALSAHHDFAGHSHSLRFTILELSDHIEISYQRNALLNSSKHLVNPCVFNCL